VLGDVRECLRDDEVRGRLYRRGKATLGADDGDRYRCALRERAQGRGEAAVGEDCGVDAARELAELVKRLLQLLLGIREQFVGARRPLGKLGAGELEGEAECEEALLRSVVEVALEPTSLCVAGGDDPGPRCSHLFELRAQLGMQSLVLERQARRGRYRVHELGLLRERRVVDEHGYGPLIPIDDCGATSAHLRRNLDRLTLRVDERS
jgi:hypothetical protein